MPQKMFEVLFEAFKPLCESWPGSMESFGHKYFLFCWAEYQMNNFQIDVLSQWKHDLNLIYMGRS